MMMMMQSALLMVTVMIGLVYCSHRHHHHRHHPQDVLKTSHQDVQQSVIRFSHDDARSFSALVFDASRAQVIAAARDYLFRLSLDGLKLLEESSWPAADEKIRLCQVKGQSEEDCRNYIRLLHVQGDRVLACGTNAFSPSCSWRPIEAIDVISEWSSGIARVPHSPHSRMSSLLSSSSSGGADLYTGLPTDFSGQDKAIYRLRLNSSNQLKDHLRTKQHNIRWLNAPEFVAAVETDLFVYFFFRETAVEAASSGVKTVYSRVARVCKNDPGGNSQMLKDTWTTFVKARLNCSVPAEFPFYYDYIQSVVYLEVERLFYATFTTSESSIPGSAVCSFTMDAVEEAFAGPFRAQSSPTSLWEAVEPSSQWHAQCSSSRFAQQSVGGSSSSLIEAEKYQLMDRAVQQSRAEGPLVRLDLERIGHLAVDIVSTKLHSSVHVLYLASASGDGLIRKYSVLPRTGEACLVEIIDPFPLETTDRQIRTMQFLKQQNALYIGTEDELMRLGASQRCRRFATKEQCLNAMDPYCGWQSQLEECTPPPNKNPLVSHWHQSITSCPVLNAPVDGNWSEWSDWTQCNHTGEGTRPGDQCACRQRLCDSPAPAHGGLPCQGPSSQVTNCTRHGGWTEWSSWSACSQPCGPARKTRRRTCGNPEPAFGGSVCVGPDLNEGHCFGEIPPCQVNAAPPIDGQWSAWGKWSECTASCGGGFRLRNRLCDNPPPQLGGADCAGSGVEYEQCNTHACSENKRVTTWTPWLLTNSTDIGRIERRFRFSCRAPVDVNLLKVGAMKLEERFCHADGTCLQTIASNTDGSWTEWSEWSDCSRPCGGGRQHRSRICDGGGCEGPSRDEQSCNRHRCRGVWSCWTEWTPCSSTCGQGIRSRSRTCSIEGGGEANELDIDGCAGPSEMKEYCNNPSCEPTEGWDAWSTWSLCDADGMQSRRRRCLTDPSPGLCQGRSHEERMCTQNLEDNTLAVASILGGGETSLSVIIGAVIGGVFLGVLLVFVVLIYALRRKDGRLDLGRFGSIAGAGGKSGIPSSSHYLSAKQQNHYVSMGSLDWRKGTSVDEMGNVTVVVNSSTLPKSRGMRPPPLKISNSSVGVSTDYPTATIKRNSGGHNQMRANIESDDIFNN